MRGGRDRQPFIHKALVGPDLDLIPAGPRSPRGRMSKVMLDRGPRGAAPTLTVSARLRNPAEAEGLTTKWAIELVFTPVHFLRSGGRSGGPLSRPIRRRDLLKPGGRKAPQKHARGRAIETHRWTYEAPHVGANAASQPDEGCTNVCQRPQGDHLCRPAVTHDPSGATIAAPVTYHHFRRRRTWVRNTAGYLKSRPARRL